MALDTQYPLPIARTIADLRQQVAAWRADGKKIALVPTMGALHEGHLSLVDIAGKKADITIVSIFVNPTQFAPDEDFSAYPRTEADDIDKLVGKAHLIFAPTASELYPPDFSTTVTVEGVTRDLEGASRPTHFAGVATIVAKLLLAALPDYALFGEKDYQQLLTVKRMVRDLHIPVEIVAGPISREPDGLARSSRNAYLTPEQRAIAAKLNLIVRDTAKAIANGADIIAALKKGQIDILKAGFDQIDYLEVRDAETLEPVSGDIANARILTVARLGQTRLLDNMPVA